MNKDKLIEKLQESIAENFQEIENTLNEVICNLSDIHKMPIDEIIETVERSVEDLKEVVKEIY